MENKDNLTDTVARLRLTNAIYKRNLAALEDVLKLIDKYPGVDEQCKTNAFVSAVKRGYHDCVRLMLTYGTRSDSDDDTTASCLESAAERGHVEVVRVLLECTGNLTLNLTRIDKSLNKALIEAVKNGFSDCVDLLLMYGADANNTNEFGIPALVISSERGHTEVVKLLLEYGSDINRSASGAWTALHWASMTGNVTIARYLLNNGANPNIAHRVNGCTPLMLGCRKGFSRIVELLLDAGCDVCQSDVHGDTAFVDAARNNKLKCLELLLFADVDINQTNSCNRTPLLAATLWNSQEAVLMLLKKGCNPNATGQTSYECNNNITQRITAPLESAILGGFLTLAKLLYSAGCDRSALYRCLSNLNDLDNEMKHWLVETSKTPRLLTEACRKHIRDFQSENCAGKLDNLPLPPVMIRYLNLGEWDGFEE